MSSEAIALWTETSSDPELIAGVRAGDTTAFGLLYERHMEAARKVASQYTNSVADVDDVVSESFSRILRALQRGDGPDLAFRAYLFTIVRRTGMDIINKGIRTKPREDMGDYEAALGYEAPSDEPTLEGFEQGMVAGAFKSLPERWQAVLWYTEVEKKSPKEIAPLLGLSANGVAALAYRAREALRQAYLQQHLNSADTLNCLEANTQLGAYVRGGLNKREHTRIDNHVHTCERCTALVVELQDVNRGMRTIIAPMVLGGLGMGALKGGMPIGGAFSNGAAGGSTAGSAGAGAAGAGSAGVGANSLAAGGFGAAFSSISGFLLPTAAFVGVAALALGGASFLGIIDPFGGNNAADAPETGVVDTPSEAITPDEGSETVDPDPASTDSPVDNVTDDVAGPNGSAMGDGDGALFGGARTGSSVGSGGVRASDTTGGASGTSTSGESTTGSSGTGSSGSDGTAGTGTSTGGTAGPGSGTDTGGVTDPSPGSTTEPDPAPAPDNTSDPDTGVTTEPTPSPTTPPKVGAVLSIREAPLNFLEVRQAAPTVTSSVSNTGDTDAGPVRATITLPVGLLFAAPSGSGGGPTVALRTEPHITEFLAYASAGTFDSGDWTCELSSDFTRASCNIDELAADATADLDLSVAIDTFTGLADDAKTSFDVVAGDQHATYEVRTGLESINDGLSVAFSARGHVAATTVGSPLMGCDLATQTCRTAMRSLTSTAANNSQNMVALNTAGGVRNSAVTSLDLPTDAKVLYATLEWSANAHINDAPGPTLSRDDDRIDTDAYKSTWFDASLTSARIKAPGTNEYSPLEGSLVSPIYKDSSQRSYYQTRANVTELVRKYGAGDWSVADIALSRSARDSTRTYYGGFALTVIYESAQNPTARVAIFDGSRWVSNAASAEFNFFTGSTSSVGLGWVAWDSDRNNTGDRAQIDGAALTPKRWNGPAGTYVPLVSERSILGNSDDAADATAAGSAFSNSLGVDAKTFVPSANLAPGKHTLRATSSGDNYLLSSVTVTVVSES